MPATISRDAPDPAIAGKGYVKSDVLVSTAWLANHLDDPRVRIAVRAPIETGGEK